MKYGIIVAMQVELDMLLREMAGTELVTLNGIEYHTGCIGSTPVVATQCGIGKVNAAVGALTMIEHFKPDVIVNTGIAGGTGAGAGVLDVVIGRQVGYHDVWCGPGNAPGQVQGHPERYNCATALFDIDTLASDPRVKVGLIASGDKFVSAPADLEAVLRVQPDAVAVDMESGAIAQVCHIKGVPFLAIRVVSDTPGVENHLEQYADFWSLAPQSTFGILRRILTT
ncbi:MAG: 5'-methylthioadenosine/adenosylhomocysteine nucleosidase [Muribaculaceae bacterium]|nr:5'-methylthioadenosine/adenosylhomocysteine nucleosidase [Muribaculaceae bacterium]